MNENILTIEETAQYLKVSPSTIYKLILQSNLPATKVANKWRIKKSKLDGWVDFKEYNKEENKTQVINK